MQTSEKGLALLEQREGFRARAYRDTGGKWTIGFGHLIRSDEAHLRAATLTLDEATVLLRSDVADAEGIVSRHVTVPLTQNQFDALVVFAFNVGDLAVEAPTLLRLLNAGQYDAVPAQLMRFVYDHEVDPATGARVAVKVAGLVTRRKAEIALYTGAA